MYFEPGQIHGATKKTSKINPGFAAAFFGAPDVEPVRSDLDFEGVQLFRTFEGEFDFNEDEFAIFSDTVLRGKTFTLFDNMAVYPKQTAEGEIASIYQLERRNLYNRQFSNFILDSDIVYESSPPKGIQVRQIIKSATGAGIGLYLGINGPSEPLLFVSVPFGVILMGSAFGVAKAFEKGINRVVERKFKKWSK